MNRLDWNFALVATAAATASATTTADEFLFVDTTHTIQSSLFLAKPS